MILLALVLWIWISAEYSITDDGHVRTKFGPIVHLMPLKGIKRIRLVHRILGGPGLSSAKVEAFYGDGPRESWCWSPQDRIGFLRELKSRCPWIEIDQKDLAG